MKQRLCKINLFNFHLISPLVCSSRSATLVQAVSFALELAVSLDITLSFKTYWNLFGL